MRAKYARQIRNGVRAAQMDVRNSLTLGHLPPIRVHWALRTELELSTYDVVVRRMVAREIVASGRRVIAKLQKKGWIE